MEREKDRRQMKDWQPKSLRRGNVELEEKEDVIQKERKKDRDASVLRAPAFSCAHALPPT